MDPEILKMSYFRRLNQEENGLWTTRKFSSSENYVKELNKFTFSSQN